MIITDAHVHIYPCHNLDTVISSAFRNLFSGAQNRTETNDSAVLFLTETAGNHYFELLMNGEIHPDSEKQAKNWQTSTTEESVSLRLVHSAHPQKELFIVSGQQVVTSEKLEVLAIGSNSLQAEGTPLNETVRSVVGGNGIAILPWGVGKWLGHRGRIINDFMATDVNDLLFLGDNGSRPRFWPVSSLKRSRQTKKPRLLSGTDPLPLPGEETRVGSFGSIIQGSIDPQKPFATLKKLLARPETEITGYGNLQSPTSFIKQQVALRMAR